MSSALRRAREATPAASAGVAPRAPPSAARAPWPDLPAEVLGLVLSNLSFEDRRRSASVCSAWRAKAAALPELWEEVDLEMEEEEEGEEVEPEWYPTIWRTGALVAQLRWCEARAGAVKALRLRAQRAYDDSRRYFHGNEAAGAALGPALAATLAACGPALRALVLVDVDDLYGLFGSRLAPLWTLHLRGLRQLELEVTVYADPWPSLAHLAALTALTAHSPATTLHGTRRDPPYRRNAPLPPALRRLQLQAGAPGGAPWLLPDALYSLTGLTRLALRGERDGDARFWLANGAHVAQCRALRHLAMCGPFPAALAATTTLRSLAYSDRAALFPGPYLSHLVCLNLEARAEPNLHALVAAGNLQDLRLRGSARCVGEALRQIEELPLPRLRRLGVPAESATSAAALRRARPRLEIYEV